MKDENQSNQILNVITGFLIPYIFINGLIFFFIIARPHVNIIQSDTDSPSNQVRFSIHSVLPIIKLSVTKDEKPIEYQKDYNEYIIPVKSNGGIKIEVTSLNRATTTVYEEISTMDDISPNININDASFAVGTLTITVTDNDSGINYDNIYGIIDGENIKPIFIDKSTGTLKFKVDKGLSITIHIEDNNGNSTETTFEAN